MSKIPVRYVGLQQGFSEKGIPDFYLVDEPNGSTKKFDPEKHIITGLSDSARNRGIHIPVELVMYCEIPEHLR
jgi:hypothetical protein